jgi:hypothetical protein
MLRVGLLLMALILLGGPVYAQQRPPWRDIVIQAQRNSANEQALSAAIIDGLQADIKELREELAKVREPPKQETPK